MQVAWAIWTAVAPRAAAGEAPDRLPLESLAYTVDVAGPIAEITIRERFRNPADAPVDAVVVVPLDGGAVVDGLWLRVETREIRGEIRARDDARRVYTAARDAGTVASLAESLDPGLFTTGVANLPPGAAIEVELRLVRPVDRADGTWSVPLAITAPPRLTALGAPTDWIVPSRDTGVRASLSVAVHAATGVRSLGTIPPAGAVPDLLGATGTLVVPELPLDRDVVVAWRTERSVPQASLLVSDTHVLFLLEGAAPGSGAAWWDVSADLDRCPIAEPIGSVRHGVAEGATATMVALRAGPCRGPVRLTASSPDGRVAMDLRPRALPRPRALASAWARARVAASSDPAEIAALGLRWGIVTSETSLVAVDPGAEGVKWARMAAPPPDRDADGLFDAVDAPRVMVSKSQLLLLDAPDAPREAPAAVARRRPRGKTPLLLGGVVALGGGAALCLAAGPEARVPACAGGLGLGVVGLGAVALGVAW